MKAACALRALLAAFAVLAAAAEEPSAFEAKWPPYIRGKGQYRWALSLTDRDDGVARLGANHRLRAAVSKMLSGEPIRIAALGGSITTGAHQRDGLPWPQYVYNYLEDEYGGNNGTIRGSNGALGGTRSSYMSVCYNMHVPKDVDVVMLEYAVNDNTPDVALQRAQERLIRSLLKLPNRPAVIVTHTLSWWAQGTDNFGMHSVRSYNELVAYYRLQSVSLRGCCFDKLLANQTGFSIEPRHKNPDALEGVAFFMDPAHLDGLTGARVLAELVMHLFDLTVEHVRRRPVTREEQLESAAARLPPPLHAGNYESVADRCVMGHLFQQIVRRAEGYEWVNEASTGRARWGMVAHKPGSSIEFVVNSMATKLGQGDSVAVLVAYLRSYQHMGRALVKCVEGCTCADSTIDAHTIEHNSQMALHHINVSQHAQCVLRVEVLEATSSGEHKVKLQGVIVSEESGSNGAILSDHAGVFDRVSDAVTGHTDGFYHSTEGRL